MQQTADTLDVQDLVTAALPLVRSVVNGLAAGYPSHCDRDELVAAGTLGLVEAAQRFDPARGVPFERWAALRIRGAVVDAVRALDFAPRSLRADARDLAAVREALGTELGRVPTAQEVADRMGLPLRELVVLEGRLHRSTVLRLDAPTGDDGESSLADTVIDLHSTDPAEQILRREHDRYVQDAVEVLPERLRAIVVGYFLEGRTSGELAAELGVTESRVSQLRSQALKMMRAGLGAQLDEQVERQTGRSAAEQARYDAALAGRSTFSARITLPEPRRELQLAG